MVQPDSAPLMQSTMLETWTVSEVDGTEDSMLKPSHLASRLRRVGGEGGMAAEAASGGPPVTLAMRAMPEPPWGKIEIPGASPPRLNWTQDGLSAGIYQPV